MKRIFCYLRGTTDIGLVCGNGKECLVTEYTDSNYVADVGLGGYVVSWKSTLQSSITLSTTEAELQLRSLYGSKGLVSGLGITQEFAMLYCDSLSAIFLAKDQVHHDQTKHIDVRY